MICMHFKSKLKHLKSKCYNTIVLDTKESLFPIGLLNLRLKLDNISLTVDTNIFHDSDVFSYGSERQTS